MHKFRLEAFFGGAFLIPDKADPVYKFGGFLVSFSRFNFVLHARGEAQYLCVLRLKIKDVFKGNLVRVSG